MNITNPNQTIKSWSEDDRPREKMLAKGLSSLSDSELIAILLTTGTKSKSAVTLAKELLTSAENNLDLLGKKNINDIKKVKGIGDAKAVIVLAALELGRRRQMSELIKRPIITSSRMVFDYIGPMLADLKHEEFWVLALNRSAKVVNKTRVASGGLHSVYIDVKMIIQFALEHHANSIVLVHNHPSGSLTPSEEDKQVTDLVKQACKIFDIKLADHVIVAGRTYFSFADDCLL